VTVSSEVVALIAAGVAVLAAVVAVRATAVLARTMLAQDRQTSPPPLTAQVLGGKTRRGVGEDTREYSFSVVLTNHTRDERQVTGTQLRVTYRTRANFLGAVDLDAGEQIIVPPGQTVDVTLKFTTSNVIPRHCRIDAYTLLLAAEGGERIVVDASQPDVLRADTDGIGPKNWGWD
jgi:uncharacterized cupredoxin-like copper-binding protein